MPSHWRPQIFITIMERTKYPDQKKNTFQYDHFREPLILSKQLMDILLKEDQYSDLLALYSFYYYTAKWQSTITPKATTFYVAAGLGWTDRRVRKVKARLLELTFIEDIVERDSGGKVIGHFIKINMIFDNDTNKPPGRVNHTVVFRQSNKNNKNIYKSSSDSLISPSQFDDFWTIYPRHDIKGKALITWTKLCKQKDRPTWKEIKRAIHYQSKSDRWQDPKFIPMATTWLNQKRWLDDPKEMISFSKDKGYSKPPIYDEGVEYIWDPEGYCYRHSVSGRRYIP